MFERSIHFHEPRPVPKIPFVRRGVLADAYTVPTDGMQVCLSLNGLSSRVHRKSSAIVQIYHIGVVIFSHCTGSQRAEIA